jgi:hypothetical protein
VTYFAVVAPDSDTAIPRLPVGVIEAAAETLTPVLAAQVPKPPLSYPSAKMPSGRSVPEPIQDWRRDSELPPVSVPVHMLVRKPLQRLAETPGRGLDMPPALAGRVLKLTTSSASG